MFHEGNLQSGISLAIQEQKLVGIFVREDGPESATWENEWLQGGWVSSLLEQKAVVLRLEAGSTEAGFLSAFCKIEKVPTFVVIQNGQLQEQLTSGISKDEFINKLRKVLGAPPIPGAVQPAAAARQSSPPISAQTSSPAERAPPSSAPAPTTSPASTVPLSAKAKGKQRAIDPEPKTHSVTAAQQEARDALRKKKQEEKEELARIKARIEADKAERRSQAEARKAERQQLAQTSPTTSQFPRTASTRGSQAKDVHLNVRLFDGGIVRSTFPRTAKLQDDVRPWIDREFAARAEHPGERHPPYYFRQILAPLPSKELSMSDEDQSLGDIDLAPSATLVLIPVKGYTDAYSDGGGGIVGTATGAVTGLVGGVFGLASSALGYVGNTVASVIGGGGASAQQQGQEQPSAGRSLGDSHEQQDGAGVSSVRVRTLADQRAREPRSQQLYNGNQLNFEDRDDDTNR
ncbi:hypothetical protein K458DRAFT_353195 [Lentithecium fluviatile CBS 122367]|uniref:UBX domain-containing protein 2 n=1 Tax=Lentithecium fluviatile CBS 122367 TaxID=1168545 RepID=A0A6G1JLK9_9PLEO|nr:hypothetical protein K458DRAFT_353195 [Lentithecium fluviatile CBS 122367]